MQVVHIIYKMEVEITNHLPSKPYIFEGEPSIQDVPFNHPQTLKIYELIVSAKGKEAIANIHKSIFETFPQLLTLSISESIAKSVCAKIVSRGQTIVECLNCRMDESCIICLNCFKNGNHEGHKVLYKKAYGGCCDCGDAEAWNPKGFCKQHSGEVQDIHIQPADVSAFSYIMQDLFYLYFRLKLKKENQNTQNVALISLINVCQLIIEKGPKGIKLLALFFQSRIPLTLKYNEQLQTKSVVSHMFIWRLLGRDLKFWEPAFINMFPYYEFKKVLLATYIEYFPQLYLNEESCMAGQSLACQILTSYKLVEDYIDSPNSQPIGYNIKGIMDPEHMNYVSSMLCSDLQKIIKLQDPVPEKYIRFQSQKGVSTLFAFQDIIISQMRKQKQLVQNSNKKLQEEAKNKKKKKKKMTGSDEQIHQAFFNPILYMIRNIKQIFNQYTSLQLLSAQLHVVSKDRLSLIKMLKDLAKLIQTTPEQLVIFRAYDRAFALTLFTLCGYNLDKLLEFQFRRELMEILEKDEEGFEAWLKMVEERMLSTYFFYCHVLCNEDRGYHSSFFNYIYLYRSKDNFLISIDTLQLKMMALLSRTKTVLDFRKLLRFQDFDEEKWSCFILNTLLQELPLLYIGNFSQIYASHYEITNRDKMEVRKDVICYLSKFIVGQGNSTTLERATQFSRAFLFDNIQLLKKCLLHCCNYIKQKKIFQLKPQFREQKPFNYKEFELRLKDDKISNKNADQARPELTYPLINGYNRVIFSYYWNDQNIESIKQVMMDLYQDVVKTEVHDNIVELATIICKFCSNLRTFASLEQQAFVDEMLLRTAFSPDIKQKLTQFKGLIGEDEQVPTDMKLKEKKELLLMKKMKKMEGLKKKQEENMSTIRQVHKIEEQIHEAEQFCAICRNKENKKHQLVYLVNLNIRNLEKLANLGSGVQTASFTTCYHIFDYSCLEKECKNLYEANLKCPVCRKAGNIFFPAYPLEDQEASSPYVMACIERVTQIMMTIHSYLQLDPLEQLFKSFYHFALLSLFDPQYVRKSRLKLYRVILQMLSHRVLQKEVPELVKKLKNSDFNLNPKLLRKDKISIINVKAGGEDFFEGISDESDSQDESLIMVEHRSKKIKQKEKPQTKKKSKKYELSPIFRFFALRVLRHVFQSDKQESREKFQQIKKEKSQENMIEQIQQMSERQVSPLKNDIRVILNSQTQPEVPNEIQLTINELIGSHKVVEPSPSKPLELQLVKLPQTFHWDMSKNECDLCKQPCHDMFSCLLCPWKGCLNCKPGGVNKHFPLAHGETSAFMRVNDGVAYIIGTKMIKKVGCLFLNEWGEPLKLKNEWNSYCLQPDVLQKIRNLLLRDE